MTDDDERQILSLLKLARIAGVCSGFAGLFGLFALFQAPSNVPIANVALTVGCAGSFYLAWLCLSGGTKIIEQLETQRAVRKQRKTEWVEKTTSDKGADQ